MANKGEKLRAELVAASKTAPPWVVEQNVGGLREGDVLGFCTAAFKDPVAVDASRDLVPKASLVVGAGKLERSKFDEALPKWVTAALTSLGFVEDQSASATLSSQ